MADRTKRHRESPLKRTNPSKKTVWVARYTDHEGVRRLVKPRATFPTKREAQEAIDAAYGAPVSAPETLGAYASSWTERHPRSARTNYTNDHRLSRVLDVAIEGRALRDWPYRELKRRHAVDLVDVLLREQGRARDGAVGILRALSAMTEDAITDECAEVNAFKGVRVKKNDPRIRKAAREASVYSFEQLHEFAGCGRAIRSFPNSPARDYEALLRTITDTGRRLGEVLALERRQLVDGVFHFEGTAHNGVVTFDTETKKHKALVPASDGLLALIAAAPTRIDTKLLFPAPGGRLWTERNFYRDVWDQARTEWARRLGADVDELEGEQLRRAIAAVGADITPHDCRHSWVSHLAAAGVDEADLAEMAGHSPETLRAVYRHPLRRSFDQVREAIG
jgi:integrase